MSFLSTLNAREFYSCSNQSKYNSTILFPPRPISSSFHSISSYKKNIFYSTSMVERLSGLKLLQGHRGCVNSVLFSHDGNFIYTGSVSPSLVIILSSLLFSILYHPLSFPISFIFLSLIHFLVSIG